MIDDAVDSGVPKLFDKIAEERMQDGRELERKRHDTRTRALARQHRAAPQAFDALSCSNSNAQIARQSIVQSVVHCTKHFVSQFGYLENFSLDYVDLLQRADLKH